MGTTLARSAARAIIITYYIDLRQSKFRPEKIAMVLAAKSLGGYLQSVC
jgi:hypothetical protein